LDFQERAIDKNQDGGLFLVNGKQRGTPVLEVLMAVAEENSESDADAGYAAEVVDDDEGRGSDGEAEELVDEELESNEEEESDGGELEVCNN
jgi:hypothetical protein